MNKNIVFQRIRNRIIEVLELFSDKDQFESVVANLELWEDFVSKESVRNFSPPVFTEQEVKEILVVYSLWESVFLDTKKDSKEWLVFRQATNKALKVFMQRGFLPED